MPHFLPNPVENPVGCGHQLGLTRDGQNPPQLTEMELDDFAGGVDPFRPDMHVLRPGSLFGMKEIPFPGGQHRRDPGRQLRGPASEGGLVERPLLAKSVGLGLHRFQELQQLPPGTGFEFNNQRRPPGTPFQMRSLILAPTVGKDSPAVTAQHLVVHPERIVERTRGHRHRQDHPAPHPGQRRAEQPAEESAHPNTGYAADVCPGRVC